MASNDLDFSSDFDYDSDDFECLAPVSQIPNNQANLKLTSLTELSAESADNSTISSDSDDSNISDDDNNQSQCEFDTNQDTSATEQDGLSQFEELRFVFDTLDMESVPDFDNWEQTESVFCQPPFTPSTTPGPTSSYPADMKPIDFFNLFYDDELLQKVCYE